MIIKNTLVMDDMPDLFWKLVQEKGYEEYFTQDNLLFSEDIELIILRTKSVIKETHFKRFPNLKCIIRAGSGYDNIDVKKAKDYGVTVQNTPEANIQSAFEHTIGLLFALIKNHKQHNKSVLENKWRNGIARNLEVSDLRVLVVGLGRVGSRVAKLLKLLGAEVKFVDPYIDFRVWKEKGIDSITYEEGLNWANLVSYHCPLYQQTQHYFDNQSLDFVDKIFLLNVARGGIIDIDAVVKGIEQGKILGAGIDVMEAEPWTCEGWEDNSKIIMTPHTGSMTKKAKDRLSVDCFDVWSQFNFQAKIKHPIKIW